MRGMIEELRNLILERANLVSVDQIKDDEFAQHPGRGDQADDPTIDGRTWEAYLWKKNNVSIILSFNVSNLNSDFDLQTITLQGHCFRTIRLFIFDDNPLTADVTITPQMRVDKLSERPSLSREDTTYCIEPEPTQQVFAPTQLGHALDLYIRNTGNVWSIPNSDQLEKASADLVKKVVAMLKALLPVAEYYADNREDFLAGRI